LEKFDLFLERYIYNVPQAVLSTKANLSICVLTLCLGILTLFTNDQTLTSYFWLYQRYKFRLYSS